MQIVLLVYGFPLYFLTLLYSTFLSSFLSLRVKEYEKVWQDLRNIGLYWSKVWLPSQVAYSAGVSKAIFSLVSSVEVIILAKIFDMSQYK